MQLNKKNIKVPMVRPAEFDDYIFGDWKAPVSTFYHKFHIERIENYKKHLKLPLPPHRRSVSFFIFLTHGSVVRSKGLSTYEIKSNTFFLLPADQITSLEHVSKNAKGYYCHFMPEIFSFFKRKDVEAFSFFDLTSEPIIHVTNQERILQLLSILENENKINHDARFELIPLYLFILFAELKLQLPPQELRKMDASALLTQRYKNVLAERISDLKTVQEFAFHLSVSANHLNKCVQASMGKSAHDLLDDMRILEAKVLLKQTELSIGEIAFRIGRFEPSDFARFFKSKSGTTPNHFRKNKIT
jgi:AraC family transcriptional regulator, transcriptional activator of pobA